MTEENKGQISDGYHTFDELYDHRNLLFINLCRTCVNRCCWNRNGDFEGYFCLYMLIGKKQISYHIPDKYLPLVESTIKYKEIKWDGHTGKYVLTILTNMVGG